MASNYTSQYGLCQWETEDPVKRTDFNEDNQKIEAGLLQLQSQLETNTGQLNALVETRSTQLNAQIESRFQQVQSQLDNQVAQRLAALESQLPSIQGNLYDMLLNRYYSGENLSSRKMLFLDGFKDQSLIASVTAGVCYDTSIKRPRLYTGGAQSTSSTFSIDTGSIGNAGSDARYCRWVGTSIGSTTATVSFTPSGYGTLRSVTMRLSKCGTGTADTTVQIKIFDGGNLVGASYSSTVTSNAYYDFNFTFPDGVFLAPRAYTLQIENVNQTYYLRVAYTAVDSGTLGVSYYFDPLYCSEGTLTGAVTDLGRDYTGALGWVRHIGGSVDMGLCSGTAVVPLNRIAVQGSATYKGEACTESVFQLPASGTLSRWMAVRLTLHTDNSGCILCDYGVSCF